MCKEFVEIVRCKNCIHRPIKGEDVHDTYPPKDSRGYDDYTCPCLNEDDYWYSWSPSDEWFCANGEVKQEEKMGKREELLEEYSVGYIEDCIAFTQHTLKLPNCNTCIKSYVTCPYKPKAGEWVRFNCYNYLGPQMDTNVTKNCDNLTESEDEKK